MEKTLGQEYSDPAERISFLSDNAEKKEEIDYNKPLTQDELEGLKDDLATNSIKLGDVEEQKKDSDKAFKDQIDGFKDHIKDDAEKLKYKSVQVTENCFKFVDEEAHEIGYYNHEGVLVYSRPARSGEIQGNLFKTIKGGKNGTED